MSGSVTFRDLGLASAIWALMPDVEPHKRQHLNRWGRCVSCDQPRGSNPNRCAVCARACTEAH
jgi:hypothetical protein